MDGRPTPDARTSTAEALEAHVANVRCLGMVAAFNLLEDANAGRSYPSAHRRGYNIYLEELKEGLILRLLGDTIYYWLPHCTTAKQLRDIVDQTCRVLDRLGYRFAT